MPPTRDDRTDGSKQGWAPAAPQVTRRDAVKAGALALGLTGAAALREPAFAASATPTGATPIRLASVATIQDGGLLPVLLAPFEVQTGHRVQIYLGDDVYTKARAGKADLVFSHFGHKDAQSFIAAGLGQWPRMVLCNSIALLVPARDPAHVAGLGDPVEAFRRIAAARAPFIVNCLPVLVYLADVLWNAAGRPAKAGWYADTGVAEDAAMQAAAARGGYSLWGVTPFLVAQQKARWTLRPVLYDDEMFHRVMVSVVVNPVRFPAANVAGALALQEYLLSPVTQALILGYRYPGIAAPLFWPAGRNNAPALLPLGSGPGTHTQGHH